jgi:hypothetical protein
MASSEGLTRRVLGKVEEKSCSLEGVANLVLVVRRVIPLPKFVYNQNRVFIVLFSALTIVIAMNP